MNGTELAFNIAGWGFTILLGVYGGVILWLHTWLKTIERREGEDDGED